MIHILITNSYSIKSFDVNRIFILKHTLLILFKTHLSNKTNRSILAKNFKMLTRTTDYKKSFQFIKLETVK